MVAKLHRKRPYRTLAGVGAGAGAALAMIVAMAALRFAGGLPSIPELLLNPIVRLMGGEAFSSALDNLYYAGRPLLFTVILEGTLLLGALLGLAYARLAKPDPLTGLRARIFDNRIAGILYGLLIGVLLNTVFLPLVDQPVFADRPYGIYSASGIPLWLGLMILALIFGVTLDRLLPEPPAAAIARRASAPGAAEITPFSPSRLVAEEQATDRRHFLRIAGGTLLAVLGGVAFVFGGAALNQGSVTPVRSVGAGEGDVAQNTGAEVEPTEPGDVGSVPQAQPTAQASVPTDTPDPPTPTAEPTRAPEPTSTPEQVEPSPVPTDTPAPTPEPPTVEPPTATSEPTQAPQPTAKAAAGPPPAIKVKEITPTESFYHVSKNFFDPVSDGESWKLEIKGMVSKPYSLSLKDLFALKAVSVTTGMMCISNPIGGGLIGNTTWKGVHLADLIKRAGPKKGVVDVVMRALDDYSDSIPYAKALDPDVMLVWEMGGELLTPEHGFPARVLVPGIYGMKHVKWITSIELVNYDFKGYWQNPSQGWSDPAPVNVMSRIDFPTNGTLTTKTQSVSGIAFAGDRSISKVEISTDGGKTWQDAYVKPPSSGTSWVVWGYNWTPARAGKYTLQVRATDGQGNLQDPKRTDPYPNGATGYHSVTYVVKAAGGQVPEQDEAANPDIQQPPARKSVRIRGLGDPGNQ
jgi:DMSO/TMAO reductase YedYZ molybdopterin-dependent catalytic subunit